MKTKSSFSACGSQPISSTGRVRRNLLITTESFFAMALVVGLYAIASAAPQHGQAMNVAMGCVSLLAGTLTFIRHGGGRITPLGLFSYACALIIGYGGIRVALDPYFLNIPETQRYLSSAIAISAFSQVAIAQFGGRHAASIPARTQIRARDARWAILVGAGVLILLYLAGPGLTSIWKFREGMAFSAALLVVVGVVFLPRDVPLPVVSALVASPLVVYVVFFHNGTGRLRIVALACAILLLVTSRFPRRWMKWGLVAAAPLALWWMSVSRLRLEESLHPGASSGEGLSSLFASVGVFAQVIYAQEQGLTLGFGTSFLTPLFVVIPEWKPDWMPEAIGYELVKIVAPELFGTGHSTVASVFGEWWWNFAAIGPIVAIPILGLLLTWLDRRFAAALIAAEASRGGVLRLVLWAAAAGSLGDLVWGGVHIWIVRMFARVTLLLILWPFSRTEPESAGSHSRGGLIGVQEDYSELH